MKYKLPLIPACFAFAALCAPLIAKPTPPVETTAERALPFKGTIAAVDQVAKTFTIGKRVFQVTEKTVLTKDGAAVTMKDVMANEAVRGSYLKAADGTLEAKTVKLGPMTDAEKAEKKPSKKKKIEDTSAAAAPSASPKP